MAKWRRRTGMALAAAALALTTACTAPGPSASGLGYVTGTPGAEDVVALPGTKWIVAGGLAEANRPGGITLVDREARRAVRAEPIAFAHDSAAFPECPGPYDPARLSTHGINVRSGRGGALLYAVNHGGREAVEVFRVATGDAAPRLTWIGCVPLPPGTIGNGVAPLPGGGLAVALTAAPEHFPPPARADQPPDYMARLPTGETTGHAIVWRPGQGWRKVSGSEGSGPNGIEASPDGTWLWIALWGSRQVIRVPTEGPGEKTVLELAMWPDNVRWGEDGALWVAGAADAKAYFACRQQAGCRADYALARIDAKQFRVDPVAHPDARPAFGDATTALLVGGELWLAAYPGERLAVLKPEK